MPACSGDVGAGRRAGRSAHLSASSRFSTHVFIAARTRRCCSATSVPRISSIWRWRSLAASFHAAHCPSSAWLRQRYAALSSPASASVRATVTACHVTKACARAPWIMCSTARRIVPSASLRSSATARHVTKARARKALRK